MCTVGGVIFKFSCALCGVVQLSNSCSGLAKMASEEHKAMDRQC